MVLVDEDATVTFNISDTGSNQAPVVSGPIMVSLSENDAVTNVDLLANASDPDGDSMTVNISSTTGDQSGISVNGSDVTVTPSAYSSLDVNDSETIVFTYTVEDGNGGSSGTTTATITINGADPDNDPPTVSGPGECNVHRRRCRHHG